MTIPEHPFAEYVRVLGKGKTGTRSLDFDEARKAFSMILAGEVEPLQLGAFLMLLRVKEESAAELAGFVAACRDHLAVAHFPAVDLDWSSYAGKKGQQPWYILSALLLAENGVRVLMHGSGGHTPARLYSEQTLAHLGIQPASDQQSLDTQLEQIGFAYLPLRNLCQPLDDLLQLKPILGLRSPVNTLVRMLNPARASYSIQSIFHPAYADLHAGADALLDQPHSMVLKGDGGEVEIKPQATTRCLLQRYGEMELLEWPRRLPSKQTPVATLDAGALIEHWRHDNDDYGRLAVIETTACALFLMQKAESTVAARSMAEDYWQSRQRDRF